MSEVTPSFAWHFGQLVWAKLASAPFWPAVIFTEENQPWFREKGKSTYVHVFFFGETAERSWIQTNRLLPFLGTQKLVQQRNQWRRKMKLKTNDEQKLTAKDKTNLNVAIKQTVKLAEFSLRKRVTILKDEWWYWEDEDVTPSEPTNRIDEDEELLRYFNSNSNELDDIICLSDSSLNSSEQQRKTASVCFHPLTPDEEEEILREMFLSADSSFSACRRVAENEYFVLMKKNLLFTSLISEHWFYLFVFRHAQRLAEHFPHWIDHMKIEMKNTSTLSAMHLSQLQSLVVFFEHLPRDADLLRIQ